MQNMGRTCCVQKLFWMSETISVHNMFSLCSAKRRASDRDLPVQYIIIYCTLIEISHFFHFAAASNFISLFFPQWEQNSCQKHMTNDFSRIPHMIWYVIIWSILIEISYLFPFFLRLEDQRIWICQWWRVWSSLGS